MALATAEEDVELTQGLDQSLVCAAGVALAFALLEDGRAERAARVLIDSSGGAELSLIPGVWRPRALELLTRCWLALGRRDEAKRAAAESEATAAILSLRMAESMAGRAAAYVALDGGDSAGAAERALASADASADVGAPSRPQYLAPWRAGPWPQPGTASGPPRSCSVPRPSFTPAAR